MRTGSRFKCVASAVWLTAAIVAAAPPAGAQERQVPQSKAEVLLSFARVAKAARPAVVNVYASRTEKRPRNPLFDDPIFRQFFGDVDFSGVAALACRGAGGRRPRPWARA